MKKVHYIKPPITISEQVALLKSRKLVIDDEMRATHWLETTSYYRLSGYMYPFLADKERHIYRHDAKFEDVVGLYLFDSELRLLVFGAIEKIKVAIRAQIAYRYSNDLHNPFWLLDSNNFRSPQEHSKLVCKITDDVKRSKAVFIEHFYDKYIEPLPPAWMTFETITLGELSLLYKELKRSPTHKNIAAYFGVKEVVFESWLHTLTYTRNVWAHHARLWNRTASIAVKIPKSTTHEWTHFHNIPCDRFFALFCMVIYLLRTVSSNNTFIKKFCALLDKYPNIDIKAMGFPSDWQNDAFMSFE